MRGRDWGRLVKEEVGLVTACVGRRRKRRRGACSRSPQPLRAGGGCAWCSVRGTAPPGRPGSTGRWDAPLPGRRRRRPPPRSGDRRWRGALPRVGGGAGAHRWRWAPPRSRGPGCAGRCGPLCGGSCSPWPGSGRRRRPPAPAPSAARRGPSSAPRAPGSAGRGKGGYTHVTRSMWSLALNVCLS